VTVQERINGAEVATATGDAVLGHPYNAVAWLAAKLAQFGERALRIEFQRQLASVRVKIGNECWNFPIGDPLVTTVDFVNGTNASGLNEPHAALSGSALIEACNTSLTRQFRLAFLVEQTPEERNCVTLAAETDHLGLPRPAIKYDFSQYTKDGLVSAKKLADQIFAKMGAQQFTSEPSKNDPCSFPTVEDGRETAIKYFGSGHIVGTHRMGSDKTKSVVDGNQRSWDHRNLFVTGSGSFPTVATGNPSLTIAALALRTADTILETDLRN
jgi:choline dehydrogenase-like flavoprotein